MQISFKNLFIDSLIIVFTGSRAFCHARDPQSGIHLRLNWIPASAGMTVKKCRDYCETLNDLISLLKISLFVTVDNELISKFLLRTVSYLVVIPAKAGIHVSQGLKWTPTFAGVTDSPQNNFFEIGSISD